jgi:hypothetical protein
VSKEYRYKYATKRAIWCPLASILHHTLTRTTSMSWVTEGCIHKAEIILISEVLQSKMVAALRKV